jgi:hypothetical protein
MSKFFRQVIHLFGKKSEFLGFFFYFFWKNIAIVVIYLAEIGFKINWIVKEIRLDFGVQIFLLDNVEINRFSVFNFV